MRKKPKWVPWRCPACQRKFWPVLGDTMAQAESGRCCFCEQWERTTVRPGAVSPDQLVAADTDGGRPRMGDGPVVLRTPYSLEFPDNYGLLIRITVTFNEATRAITGCTVFRDIGCQWGRIFVGVGADGTVESSSKVFAVPEGTTNITPAQLSTRGVSVIEDITSFQITAGP